MTKGPHHSLYESRVSRVDGGCAASARTAAVVACASTGGCAPSARTSDCRFARAAADAQEKAAAALEKAAAALGAAAALEMSETAAPAAAAAPAETPECGVCTFVSFC